MRILFAVLSVAWLVASTNQASACQKTFELMKLTALEGDACSSAALNDADRELETAYQRMPGPDRVTFRSVQAHWVGLRNACVSAGKDDCVAMTKARAALFNLMAGEPSGRRLNTISAETGTIGPRGYETMRTYYHFAKARTAGEKFFNDLMMSEFSKTRDMVHDEKNFNKELISSADRKCVNRILPGTAILDGDVIRVPIYTLLGCNDPAATEQTTVIAVDLERGRVVP